jgi:ribonuclease Y
MEQIILLSTGAVVALLFGSVLGYFARQTIAKRDHKALETTVQKKMDYAKEKSREIIIEAKEKSTQMIDSARKEAEEKTEEIFKKEKFIFKRESVLEERISEYEKKEKIFNQRVKRLKEIKEEIEAMRGKAEEELVKIAGLSKEEAKEELYKALEHEYEGDVLERIGKLEREGEARYVERAKEILASVIQKYSSSQVQEITTTNVTLPDDDIKGRIIGKEGRNIKTLEKLTGVEVVVDDTPGTVIISCFDPIRRHIAKTALEKLIFDGRIQPARIEEMVEKAEQEISDQIKKKGEGAVYEAGVIDLDPKVVNLLGRLHFRSSYGQNVLNHSMEVSFLAEGLASEIGANVSICKKAGLLHDIGKSLDHQIEGSHVDIGIRILQKFGVEEEVIKAMKAHHEEYPYESIEAVIVQTADAISGGRPGARKDSLENYLKRLTELEDISNSFNGVEKSYAIQAGREIRVFVKPEDVSDLDAKKMAREIANRIQSELKYPGEIKVTLIREKRVVEYAK